MKVIGLTGGIGSGKSTVLQYMAWTLAHALLADDPELAVERLGFVLPRDEEDNPKPSELELPRPPRFELWFLAIGHVEPLPSFST